MPQEPTGLKQDRRGSGYHYPDADEPGGTTYKRQFYDIQAEKPKRKYRGPKVPSSAQKISDDRYADTKRRIAARRKDIREKSRGKTRS